MSTLVVGVDRWSEAASLAGSAGIDTSLPSTESATTVRGRGTYADLEITVNQTRNLSQQAISLSWTGGLPTFTDATSGTFRGFFGGNYLQIFQCWGDDDGTNPENPGPPPQQCEFGGENNKPTYPVQTSTFANTRVISTPPWTCGATAPPGCRPYSDETARAESSPDSAYLDPTGFVLSPFRAVDGTLVEATVDYNAQNGPLPYRPFNTNEYFDYYKTNEIPFTRTYPDGRGQDLFQVLTGLEAKGLGCGQETQRAADGSLSVPKCWLVVVPRGSPAQENMTGDGSALVNTSPLTPTAWRNRIAIPLAFTPIGSSCAIGREVRRISGGELLATAVASWQPALCAIDGAPPYSYGVTSEDRARSQLASGVPNLVVSSKPIDPVDADPANPLVYAPISLSGVVVGFNIQRVPAVTPEGNPEPDQVPLAGLRVTKLQLTPRLMAKLLTQSYRAQYYAGNLNAPDRAWQKSNPVSIVTDPDFLRFNPEFADLRTTQAVEASGLVVDGQSSDAAAEVWHWILSDPEAADWLAGRPDDWGMEANPHYSTVAAQNPSGSAFGASALDRFPKSDPYCWSPPDDGFSIGNPPRTARPLCSLDWAPYVSNLRRAAAATRAANVGAKTELDLTASEASTAWKSAGPQVGGTHFVLSITDSPSAAKFGLQTASLSRAGDDGASRQFVAPDDQGLLTGLDAMEPTTTPGVLAPNPSATMSGAYPLTMLTYAATTPLLLDAAARTEYFLFITYAATDGQVPGDEVGSLPRGYVPLPDDLVAQAVAAALNILDPSGLPRVLPEPEPEPATEPVSVEVPAEEAPAPAGRSVTTPTTLPAASDAAAPSTSTTLPPTASAETPALAVGVGRYAVPFGFGAGLVAMVASEALADERRRRWATLLRRR
jgi:hypothetical protein